MFNEVKLNWKLSCSIFKEDVSIFESISIVSWFLYNFVENASNKDFSHSHRTQSIWRVNKDKVQKYNY